MIYLVGDIGNTLTKISLFNNNFKIIKSYGIETYKLKKNNYINTFFKKMLNKKLNSTFLFSSVVPDVYKNISFFLNLKLL